jgi:hypothetical protein
MRLRKLIGLIIVSTIPLLLFVSAWQAFRYEMTESEVHRLESEQRDWLEKNKKLLIGIEVLSTPERMDLLAGADDGIERVLDRESIIIRVEPGATDGGG